MIASLDHLVLTVSDADATLRFYGDVLGMKPITFNDDRLALVFGEQKINVHVRGHEIRPHAKTPVPGSADLCLIASVPLNAVMQKLALADIPIELGPVDRTGATGPLLSIYVRDPDGNLIEISRPRD